MMAEIKALCRKHNTNCWWEAGNQIGFRSWSGLIVWYERLWGHGYTLVGNSHRPSGKLRGL